MSSSRDGASFWSRLRPRASVDSTSFSSRPALPMDIWNLLDGVMEVPPGQGRTSRLAGSFLDELHDMERFFTDRVWLTNRNREREERPPERVNTAAVLRKCRKVVYKPSKSIWGKAKVDTEHSECAVCLEKLVAKDKLLMLPCKHQFHVDCLTPWIKCNRACCPCCRADILRGPNKDEKASAGARERDMVGNLRQLVNSRGRDIRIDSSASNQFHIRERSVRYESGSTASNTGRYLNSGAWERVHEYIAWEGLHDYIMDALAEVDADLNRSMR